MLSAQPIPYHVEHYAKPENRQEKGLQQIRTMVSQSYKMTVLLEQDASLNQHTNGYSVCQILKKRSRRPRR